MRYIGRRMFLKTLGALGLSLGLHTPATAARHVAESASATIARGAIDKGALSQSPEKIHKTEEEWRSELSPEQFRVARLQGTERPYSGIYNDNKKPGIYECICCGYDLFSSAHKFDSGTGWPSFWKPLSEHSLREDADYSYFMKRRSALQPMRRPPGPRVRRRAAAYPDTADLIRSTAAARINGFLGGFGTLSQLNRLRGRLGLSTASEARLEQKIT
jgi:peptide-methionine (R)-S-oxide reductase